MKSPKAIRINIPTPCHENWQEMAPNEQGRFCASCQKTVVDFTGWTNKELSEFFLNNQNQVCGRVTTTQLNQTLVEFVPKKRKLYKLAALLGLSSFFILDPEIKAQTNDTVIENNWNKTGVKGHISNTKSEPLGWTVVRLISSNEKQDTIAVLSDTNGVYRFQNIHPGKYSLRVNSIGYNTFTVSPIYVCEDSFTEQNFVLDEVVLGGMSPVIVYEKGYWRRHPWQYIKKKVLKIEPLWK